MTITSQWHYNLVLELKINYHVVLCNLQEKERISQGLNKQGIKNEIIEIEKQIDALNERLMAWRSTNGS